MRTIGRSKDLTNRPTNHRIRLGEQFVKCEGARVKTIGAPGPGTRRWLSVAVVVLVLSLFVAVVPTVVRTIHTLQYRVDQLVIDYLVYRRLATAALDEPGRIRAARAFRRFHRDAAAVLDSPLFIALAARNPDLSALAERTSVAIAETDPRGRPEFRDGEGALIALRRHLNDQIRQLYRALSAVIWASLVLLLGLGLVLVELFRRNRSLLQSRDMLIAETHHRVKNNLTLVASLLSLKEQAAGDDLDLQDVRNQIDAVRHTHETLMRSDSGLAVPMRDYLRDLLHSVAGTAGTGNITVEIDAADVTLPAKHATTVGIVVNEIATNAVKHAFGPEGSHLLALTLHCQNDDAEPALRLTVRNSGRPFPERVETRGSGSLGLQLVEALVQQLNGRLSVRREPQTWFEIVFPAPDQVGCG